MNEIKKIIVLAICAMMTVTVFGATKTASKVPTPPPIYPTAYWNFDGSSLPYAADRTTPPYNLTPHNGANPHSLTDHLYGDGSAYFDGNGGYLNGKSTPGYNCSPKMAIGTSSFTVNISFKTSATVPQYHMLVSTLYHDLDTNMFNRGWEIWLTNGQLYGGIIAGSTYYPPVYSISGYLCNGVWHQVSMIRDVSTLTLYIDGVFQSQTTGINADISDNFGLYVGARATHTQASGYDIEYPWSGYIDELAFYKAAVYPSTGQCVVNIPFDEKSTSYLYATDNTTNPLNLYTHGATLAQAGWLGNSVSLDGINDYLGQQTTPGGPEINKIKFGTGSFGVSIWFYSPSTDGVQNRMIASSVLRNLWTGAYSHGWEIWLNYGYVYARIGNSVSWKTVHTTSSGFRDNKWHHVALVRNSDPLVNMLQLYVDNSLADQVSGASSIDVTNTYGMCVGARATISGTQYGTEWFYKGNLDELRMFNTWEHRPIAEAGADQILTTAGQSVAFDGGKSYNPLGYIAAYQWNFGDNSQATWKSGTHVYSNVGYYTATLTVTGNGQSALQDQDSCIMISSVFVRTTPCPYDTTWNWVPNPYYNTDGFLYVVYMHGQGESREACDLMIMNSTDLGVHWNGPVALKTHSYSPYTSYEGGRLFRTSSGRILLTYYIDEGGAYHQYVQYTDDGMVNGPLCSPWSTPVLLDSPYWIIGDPRYDPTHTKPRCLCDDSEDFTQLPQGSLYHGGRILLPVSWVTDTTPGSGIWHSGVYVSDDDGVTWSLKGEIMVQGSTRGAIEPSLIRYSNGDLEIFLRNHLYASNTHYRTVSYDGGESWWETPEPSPFRCADETTGLACCCDASQLSNGNQIMIWDYSATTRLPLAISVSRDNFRTITAPQTIDPDQTYMMMPNVIQINNNLLIFYSYLGSQGYEGKMARVMVYS